MNRVLEHGVPKSGETRKAGLMTRALPYAMGAPIAALDPAAAMHGAVNQARLSVAGSRAGKSFMRRSAVAGAYRGAANEGLPDVLRGASSAAQDAATGVERRLAPVESTLRRLEDTSRLKDVRGKTLSPQSVTAYDAAVRSSEEAHQARRKVEKMREFSRTAPATLSRHAKDVGKHEETFMQNRNRRALGVLGNL